MSHYDIAIIGAGPAGCAAALTLQNSNKKIALFEKDTFPRHKICGDGICDRSINTLRKISETYYQEFITKHAKQSIQKTALIYKNKTLLLNFKNFGYVLQRFNFDQYLFSLTQKDCKNIDIKQNSNIINIEKSENGYILTTKQGAQYSSSLIIIANGVKSALKEKVTGTKFFKEENGFAVRAYYEGIRDLKPDTIELHYKKEFFPGYLWIFPVTDKIANVGFGYHLRDVKKHSETFQESFQSWLSSDEKLQKRFAKATPSSRLQGGLIPYNTNHYNCAGDHYMICGDAASLIDPISAGGIGNSMLSGYYAAKQAEICCESNDFSKHSTLKYEIALKKHIQKEIKTRHLIQQTISKHPWLLDILSFIGKSSTALNKIKDWYIN